MALVVMIVVMIVVLVGFKGANWFERGGLGESVLKFGKEGCGGGGLRGGLVASQEGCFPINLYTVWKCL